MSGGGPLPVEVDHVALAEQLTGEGGGGDWDVQLALLVQVASVHE